MKKTIFHDANGKGSMNRVYVFMLISFAVVFPFLHPDLTLPAFGYATLAGSILGIGRLTKDKILTDDKS